MTTARFVARFLQEGGRLGVEECDFVPQHCPHGRFARGALEPRDADHRSARQRARYVLRGHFTGSARGLFPATG